MAELHFLKHFLKLLEPSFEWYDEYHATMGRLKLWLVSSGFLFLIYSFLVKLKL